MNFVSENIGPDDSRWKETLWGKFTQCLIYEEGKNRCLAHFLGQWAKRDAGLLLATLNDEPQSTIKRGSLVVTNIAEKLGGKEQQNIFIAEEDETDESVYILLRPKFVFAYGMFIQVGSNLLVEGEPSFSATIWNDPIGKHRNYVPLSKQML